MAIQGWNHAATPPITVITSRSFLQEEYAQNAGLSIALGLDFFFFFPSFPMTPHDNLTLLGRGKQLFISDGSACFQPLSSVWVMPEVNSGADAFGRKLLSLSQP